MQPVSGADNPPAFPTEWSAGLEPGEPMQTGPHAAQYPGMTLRDWFAGQALAQVVRDVFNDPHLATKPPSALPDIIAGASYQIADAMLAKRCNR